MKIIAGKYKNRDIPTIKTADYRPSTSKFREALFSILSSGKIFDLQFGGSNDSENWNATREESEWNLSKVNESKNILQFCGANFGERQGLINAKILDLYAGTGILSFESLSRGAKEATLIDNNLKHLKLIEKFAHTLGEANNINCRLADASSLPKSDKQYNIVFMDPPYYTNLWIKTLLGLVKNNWLENRAVIVMEMEKKTNLMLDDFPNLRLLKEKVYGNSKLLIAVYEQN